MFLLFILVFSSVYYVVSSLFMFLCFGFFFSFRGWGFFLFLSCCLVFMMGCSFGVRVGVDIVYSFSRYIPAVVTYLVLGFLLLFLLLVLFCFVLGFFVVFLWVWEGVCLFLFGVFCGVLFCVFSPYYFSLTN